jgi:L-methionine (R)-S-oxide reductase
MSVPLFFFSPLYFFQLGLVLIISNMLMGHDRLLLDLQNLVSTARDRVAALQGIAEVLKRSGSYRWVGLYEVDRAAGTVTNIVWSGPGAPDYPTFPITKGLTGAAISARKTVNVGDVTADPRYLTAFGTTRSEIIVPVLDSVSEDVVGTIDVESNEPNAFSEDVQALLEECASVIRPLWRR